jgi:hypothetical protein|tara:strand:+ start:57 stop:287 length:231 start_codon:yes stop_codon:yes gene_type:complete
MFLEYAVIAVQNFCANRNSQEVIQMLVKPRTPAPFRPFKASSQLIVNHERAKLASAKRIISIGSIGNDRYGRKRDS